MVQWGVGIAAEDGGNDGQVRGRVGHPQASGNVEEHILLRKLEANPFLQHSQEHIQSSVVETRGRALRCAIGCCAHQCLHFNEEGSHALHGSCDGYSAEIFLMFTEQELAGVGHGAQTILPHLVDT